MRDVCNKEQHEVPTTDLFLMQTLCGSWPIPELWPTDSDRVWLVTGVINKQLQGCVSVGFEDAQGFVNDVCLCALKTHKGLSRMRYVSDLQ